MMLIPPATRLPPPGCVTTTRTGVSPAAAGLAVKITRPCGLVDIVFWFELPDIPIPPVPPVSTLYCTKAWGIGPEALMAVTVTLSPVAETPEAMNGVATT